MRFVISEIVYFILYSCLDKTAKFLESISSRSYFSFSTKMSISLWKMFPCLPKADINFLRVVWVKIAEFYKKSDKTVHRQSKYFFADFNRIKEFLFRSTFCSEKCNTISWYLRYKIRSTQSGAIWKLEIRYYMSKTCIKNMWTSMQTMWQSCMNSIRK